MSDVYLQITESIMACLEAGTIPWRKPWSGGGAPRNLISSRPYQGMNALMLGMQPYASPYWLTFKQARERGGSVRKGEHGCRIVFWKVLQFEGEGDTEDKMIPYLNSWTVFNVAQCDGLDVPVAEPHPFSPIESAEQIVAAMPQRPPILHDGGGRAFYRPITDDVHMPKHEQFDPAEAYYSVLFHELGHSTGHVSRLARPEIVTPNGFGSDPYSREELVAEMTAAFLCGVTGIAPATVTNSSAYIASWLKVFQSDKKLLISAASQAQKAADFIRNIAAESEAA